MVVNRIFGLRIIYIRTFDLPRFCDRPPKGPPSLDKPSADQAFEILRLMLPEPRRDGDGKFDSCDLKPLKKLMKSLQEKALRDVAAKVGGKTSGGDAKD